MVGEWWEGEGGKRGEEVGRDGGVENGEGGGMEWDRGRRKREIGNRKWGMGRVVCMGNEPAEE